jgi:hypothetical protein
LTSANNYSWTFNVQTKQENVREGGATAATKTFNLLLTFPPGSFGTNGTNAPGIVDVNDYGPGSVQVNPPGAAQPVNPSLGVTTSTAVAGQPVVFNLSIDPRFVTQHGSFQVSTADGTGTAGVNYTPVSQTMPFDPGVGPFNWSIPVPTIANSSIQGQRTFWGRKVTGTKGDRGRKVTGDER